MVAVGFEEFKREVVRRAMERPRPPVTGDFDAFVFVNSEGSDHPLAVDNLLDLKSIRGFCTEHGITYLTVDHLCHAADDTKRQGLETDYD